MTVHSEKMKVNKASKVLVLLRKSVDLKDISKGSQKPPSVSGPHFENHSSKGSVI